MKFGYGRISTKRQDLSLQLNALKEDGCDRIYWEKRSGRTLNRPRLKTLLSKLRVGDVLVFWTIDRLGRDARDLINLAYDLRDRGIILRSLTQHIDTTTLEGQCDFVEKCAEAQRELAKISRRTKAGLEAARRRGQRLGRPPALSDSQVQRARKLMERPDLCRADIAARLKVGRVTLWRRCRQL